MRRSFRFLTLSCLAPLCSLPLAGALVLVILALTGPDSSASSFFLTYYMSFPIMCLIFLVLYGVTLSSTYLDIALSMGGRRRDFFWALQLELLLLSLVGCATTAAVAQLPRVIAPLNWLPAFVIPMSGASYLALAGMNVIVLVAASLIGRALARNKVLGIVLITAAFVAAIAGIVVLQLFTRIQSFALWGTIIVRGNLPLVLGMVLAAVLAVGEVLLHRSISRTVVR